MLNMLLKSYLPKLTGMLGRKETKEFIQKDVAEKMDDCSFVIIPSPKKDKVMILKVKTDSINEAGILTKENIKGKYGYDHLLHELTEMLKNNI